MTWGVYIHIPFCKSKCRYCDFVSWAGREAEQEAYIDALGAEMMVRGQQLVLRHGTPATLYIGGGTPTALAEGPLLTLLTLVRAVFGEEIGEYTVEANPGTVTPDKLALLKKMGANRLSLGVQSFDDALLGRLGRTHTAAEAREAVPLAREAGFGNLSLDLMYGLPGQTLAGLQSDLSEAVALSPEHISIYGLQVEEGTPFHAEQEQGTLELPPETETEAMYDYLTEALPEAGYRRYEISNFARPGRESRHNLSYWQDVPYLGLGAAAHSYLGGRRYENRGELSEYIQALQQRRLPLQLEEQMTPERHMEEYAFLALRTARGIDKQAFKKTFRRELRQVYGKKINRLVRQGLLRETRKNIALTKAGAKLGNLVFAEFLLEDN